MSQKLDKPSEILLFKTNNSLKSNQNQENNFYNKLNLNNNLASYNMSIIQI